MARSLTQNQVDLLRFLNVRNTERDGCLSVREICGARNAGWRLAGRRYVFGDTLNTTMNTLEKRGLVEKRGVTMTNARTWDITPAGREALAGYEP